jgi:hypothetical protein
MASTRERLPRNKIGHILVAGAVLLSAPVSAQSSFRATNPSSSLTLTADTLACSGGQPIANGSTSLSASNPFFVLTPSGAAIGRLRLSTNDATSTAWGGQIIQANLRSASPTCTNSDQRLVTSNRNRFALWKLQANRTDR